jgi:hypothetical protein
MGRPKGSKNKTKESWVHRTTEELEKRWDSLVDVLPEEKTKRCPRVQKAKELQTAIAVEKAEKKESRKVIRKTTSLAEEKVVSSGGTDCAETATTKVIRGYVNIQRNPHGGFYLGGDIHDTIEAAKNVASKYTINQLYVAFEVKK